MSGYLGVRKQGNRYLAGVQVKGKNVHLGSFGDPLSAHLAYVEGKRKLHVGCTL
jgi:hypothetical protein